VFGEITAYALEPSNVKAHGDWIQGLPFMVAGGIEILALIAVVVAYFFQPNNSSGLPTKAKPLERKSSEPIIRRVLEWMPSK